MRKKILFDLDGTLTDSQIGITRSVQYALDHFGIHEETCNLTKFIGPPLIDSFMEFYGFSLEKAREATDVYRERYSVTGKYENEVYEGIPKMLERLKAQGAILGVASSKPELFVKDILDHFDLLKYFDVVVGSLMDETRTKKEEVLEEALSQLSALDCSPCRGFSESLCAGKSDAPAPDIAHSETSKYDKNTKRSDIIMVGDRKYDIVAAKSYGLTAVGVAFGFAPPGELEENSPDYIAPTVSSLSDYLSNFSTR